MQHTMNVEKIRPKGSSELSALDVSAGVHLSRWLKKFRGMQCESSAVCKNKKRDPKGGTAQTILNTYMNTKMYILPSKRLLMAPHR